MQAIIYYIDNVLNYSLDVSSSIINRIHYISSFLWIRYNILKYVIIILFQTYYPISEFLLVHNILFIVKSNKHEVIQSLRGMSLLSLRISSALRTGWSWSIHRRCRWLLNVDGIQLILRFRVVFTSVVSVNVIRWSYPFEERRISHDRFVLPPSCNH